MNPRYPSLRAVAPADLALYRSARALRAAGQRVALRRTSPPRGYAVVRAVWRDVEYDGWVDVDDLMRLCHPSLGALAWRAFDRRYVSDWLSGPAAAAALPAPPDGWTRARLAEFVEAPPRPAPLLCFDAPDRARALFRAFPHEALAPRVVADVGALPLVMRFVIGETRLPLALLPAVAPGDALLVRAPRNVVRIGARALCEFRWEGETIMLNERIDDEADDEWTAVDEPVDADPGAPPLFDVEALPVTLEFTLHHERVTVARLAGCHAGMVLPLGGTPGEVTIRANGQPFGRGELIQVGERLAVEVTSLWRAKPVARDGE
ncbi:type III secretion system cytoplasmic ring protein SctQ [Burkholderia alba]|uniref:type III secretion system cytoplasmic ring protein SctQ n=1 Tax=Burkholderia alba TaxID=2683677 RepID=UPI002B056D76|nr:type III secretion system cytoplasmic ring protein SctQ [Burkholderia alba]